MIAEALIARKETSNAQLVLQDALLAARSVEERPYRTIALCDLVDVILDADEQDLALCIATEIEVNARAESHEHFIANLLISSAQVHAKVDNIQQSNEVAIAALAITEKEEDRIRKLAYLAQLDAMFTKTGNVNYVRQVELKGKALFDEIKNTIDADEYLYFGHAAKFSEAYLEAGDIDAAVIIAERWIGRNWQGAEMLARAASMLIATDKKEEGSQLAEQSANIVKELLNNKLYSLEQKKMNQSIGCVAEALTLAGWNEKAVELTAAIQDTEAKSHMLGTIALVFAQSNQAEGAWRMAEASLALSHRLPDDGIYKVQWLAKLAKALHMIGNKSEALVIIEHASVLSESLKDQNWQETEALTVLIDILIELYQPTKALAVIERITDNMKRATELTKLIRLYIDDPVQALTLANQAVESVQNIKDAKKIDVIGLAASALADVGMDADAHELAQLASITSTEVDNLYNNYTDSFCNVDQALTNEVDNLYRNYTDSFCNVAQALTKTGQFDEARKVIEKIFIQNENDSRMMSKKAEVLSALAEALEDADQHEQAIITARAALDSAHEALTSGSFNVVASALTKVGDIDNAEKTRHKALDIALNKLIKLGAY